MRAALLIPALLAACASFPEVDAAIPADAERRAPPPLLPIGDVLRAVPPATGDPAAVISDTSARAAGLSGRAGRLRAGRTEDISDRLARLRARAEILSRPAPDAAAVDAMAADLARIE